MLSGTSPLAILVASASTIAVFPTHGSPTRTGLFLVLRERICITRRSSSSLPITGSSFPSFASWVIFLQYWARKESSLTVVSGWFVDDCKDCLRAVGSPARPRDWGKRLRKVKTPQIRCVGVILDWPSSCIRVLAAETILDAQADMVGSVLDHWMVGNLARRRGSESLSVLVLGESRLSNSLGVWMVSAWSRCNGSTWLWLWVEACWNAVWMISMVLVVKKSCMVLIG